MFTPKRSTILTLLVFLAVIITACAPAPTPVPTAVPSAVPTATVKPLRVLAVRLAWKNNAEFAAVHTAMAAGYYADEGFDLKLVEGGTATDFTDVVRGEQEIGIVASVGGVVNVLSQNLPLVITGAILQKHPMAYVIMADKLTPEQKARPLEPKDLIGKKVGVQGPQELLALLTRNGIDKSKVTIQTIQGTNALDVLTGQVDFAQYWVTNQVWALQQAGKPYKTLEYWQWGVPLQADVIYTSRDRLQKDPDTMRRFLRATAKGAAKMLSDPEFAATATLKYGGGYDTPEQLKWRIAAQNERVTNEDTQTNGLLWVNPDKLMAAFKFYADMAEITKVPKLEDIWNMEALKWARSN